MRCGSTSPSSSRAARQPTDGLPAAASSDLKGSFAIPADATLNYGFNGVSTSVGLNNVGFLKTSAATFTAGTSGAGVLWSIILAGTIFNSTTAGNLQFQWAQNTSSGRATTVKAGSALMAWRLG